MRNSARAYVPSAGTVGLVAMRLSRKAILCELQPKYVEMASKRLRESAPLLAGAKP